jgi:Ca2+-binding RTX toxin-like protein
VGAAGRNVIFGLAADDRINGCGGSDIAFGNSQNDGIAGGPGNDWLSGNRGDDFVQGDSGNNVLFGGSGVNTLTGGPGRDIFVCSLNSDTVITDFVPRVDIKLGRCVILVETSTPTTLSTLGNNNNFARTQ